jgi:crotonobetainyl-CoA:carnitine CoA-transferase CaiB-like acyl-CoA transferase
MDDPYVNGREAIVEVEDSDLGSMPMHNVIPRFSAMPAPFRRQAPKIGEHTEDLRRELGLPAGKRAEG